MRSASRSLRRILIAATVGILALPGPLAAQQPAAPAQPPAPSWAHGRPDSPAAVNLAPQVAPPLATPVDKLPVAMLKVPRNFHVEVYASGMPQGALAPDR